MGFEATGRQAYRIRPGFWLFAPYAGNTPSAFDDSDRTLVATRELIHESVPDDEGE